MKKIVILSAMAFLLATTGCASYRTNSDISFSSTNIGNTKPSIPIGVDLSGKSFTKLGDVEAVVKKLLLFQDSPTKQQADVVLAEKARKMGANAVTDVTYDSGISWDSWGKITAKGTAVKINK